MNGFYINLEHRVDRRKNIEELKDKHSFFSNIKRMNAISNKRGDVGCSLSHITCLNELLKENDDYYMLIEDDLLILDDDNFKEFTKTFENIKNNDTWDLITLTPRGKTIKHNYIDGFNKIVDNQTTTGYIVKHRFIEELVKYYQTGVEGLMRNQDTNKYALDQCWKPLQEKSNFIYFNKIYAGQLEGYSDIEQKNINYNQRFLNQIIY